MTPVGRGGQRDDAGTGWNANAIDERPASRWIALYVLLRGDADDRARHHRRETSALPSIKDDLRLQPVEPGLGRQRLPDHLRRAAAAGRPASATCSAAGRSSSGASPSSVAASILCGASQSEAMLIGARLLQGIGGAMTSAVILGMIVTMFPQPARTGGRRSGSTHSSPPRGARLASCSVA